MSNTLIHEVEESLKQERLETLWKEYGGYLIAGIVMAVLATALVTGWRSWNEKIDTAQTSALLKALEQDDQAAALADVVRDLRPGQKAVARLTDAGILMRDGKTDEALEQYRLTAEDSAIEPVFRDLALLLTTRIESAGGAMDQDKARSLLRELAPLLEDEDNPWTWHTRVQAAVILAHGLGDYAGALDRLSTVVRAQNLPPSLVSRAKALEHVYALKATDEKTGNAKKEKEEPEG